MFDPQGVLWSARPLLRWDPSLDLTGPNGNPGAPNVGPPSPGTNWTSLSGESYGLCIDPDGNVWNTQSRGNTIRKYAPNGTFLGVPFKHGNQYAQGCTVDRNGDVWVAHSKFGSDKTVGHLLNNGTWLGNVELVDADGNMGKGPTGVSVDGNGKIWAANQKSNNLSRIDPTLNDGVGGVDLTVPLQNGAAPYNYGDMTGSTLSAPPETGSWTVTYDSGVDGEEWRTISWNADTPGDSKIIVQAQSSNDGIIFSAYEEVTNGSDASVPNGRYIQVRVRFERALAGNTPVLFDLTIKFTTTLA